MEASAKETREPVRPDRQEVATPSSEVSELAVFFFIVAGIMVGVGFAFMFGVPRVVGGDAYNYIIAANRGVGFIGAGIVLSLMGLAAMLPGALRERRSEG